MRIGLISDTRAAVPDEVPPQALRALEGVDLILHAGGINTRAVLDRLERVAPVKAAGRTTGDRTEGPSTSHAEGAGDDRVALQHVLHLEGHTVGLVHDLSLTGLSDEVVPGFIAANRRSGQSLQAMAADLFGTPVDIVVFGRTLYSLIEEHDGVLFINPGSPAFPRNLRRLGSVALLELGPGRRDARLVELASLD